MIEFATGNLLDADVDALVNTVNTEGVMGKGVALQFRRAYPANYEAYRAAFARDELEIGRMFVYDTGRLEHPRWIINFRA
jgi:O-acetyl-ADP-ribose deacetylase (regulator of RNase III)